MSNTKEQKRKQKQTIEKDKFMLHATAVPCLHTVSEVISVSKRIDQCMTSHNCFTHLCICVASFALVCTCEIAVLTYGAQSILIFMMIIITTI